MSDRKRESKTHLGPRSFCRFSVRTLHLQELSAIAEKTNPSLVLLALHKCPKAKEVKHSGTLDFDVAWLRVGLERPHFCTRFRGQSDSRVAPACTFAEKREARQRGVRVLLAIQKSYELLANYKCFVREIFDKCGVVLGAVRFTRYGESDQLWPILDALGIPRCGLHAFRHSVASHSGRRVFHRSSAAATPSFECSHNSRLHSFPPGATEQAMADVSNPLNLDTVGRRQGKGSQYMQ
jgi:hypothetical protein